MIGQCNLQSRIERLVQDGTFPRFSILVGSSGSGKKTLAKEIKNIFNKYVAENDRVDMYVLPDVKIDTIRPIITQAYKHVSTMIYVIPDADSMSQTAKNALLKITEEPPNKAYFIMTLEDIDNTLDTIKSRATIFQMDLYTPEQLFEYYWTIGDSPNDAEGVRKICQTPGDVNIIKDYARELLDCAQLVVDNVADVSLANALKISDKIAFKDEDSKYDLRLFWHAFMTACLETEKYSGITVTSKYLRKLRVKGINKQMLFDNWILEIRELWT